MEPAKYEEPSRSFIELLYEAPTLLEVLPPAALKDLSATCKTLRSSFCAQVTTIFMSDPAAVSKICCTTWPHLLMVKSTSGLKSHLSAQWEYLMEMEVSPSCFWASNKTALLVRPQGQPHTPSSGLSRQHCAVLSAFADKHKCSTFYITLRGPFVGCRVLQSLTHTSWPQLKRLALVDSPLLGLESVSCLSVFWLSLVDIQISNCSFDASLLLKIGTGCPQLDNLRLSNNQLDANAVWPLTQVTWPKLCSLSLESTKIGVASMHHLVSCSWPFLKSLTLEHTSISAHALLCLARGRWPSLRFLNLKRNCIDAIGISNLLQGRWPVLHLLELSVQGLDEKAYSLLGISERDQYSILASRVLYVEVPDNAHIPEHYRSMSPPIASVQFYFCSWYDRL